jgi:hypothetical protein
MQRLTSLPGWENAEHKIIVRPREICRIRISVDFVPIFA